LTVYETILIAFGEKGDDLVFFLGITRLIGYSIGIGALCSRYAGSAVCCGAIPGEEE
jgi:hypothetical protein